MRKWIDISETMATGSAGGRPLCDIFTTANVADYHLVENMDNEFEIVQKDSTGEFLILSGEWKVAYFQVVFENDLAEIRNAFVAPEYRGQGLTAKFCWFLQTREGKRILFGEHMSDDAIALARSLDRSKRFTLTWNKDGKVEPFDPMEEISDEADDGGHWAHDGPTGWRLIAENKRMRRTARVLSETWSTGDIYDLFR